eukprot:CAMPEP_0182563836 /NCGR_PEP_ID=MMETSP1324-20130603/5908_1 /TAXON_ID=236786 /ORGANISM="Florenciella sp., Strain RCC1587" /LENGTH=678 /DNA_ID=CAMNT_0024777149 /DNA_START=185 /DNA_END=2224 /DNA_ORIENTATION=+
MAPVKLAPLPVNRDMGDMGGHNDAGGHTVDPHIPATESVARKPETDVHATAHLSHISWGRAGPAVSIKNGAAADGDYDLVVVGSRSLIYHPDDVKETERHLFCTVYENSTGKPVEVARTPWSRSRDPYWSHGIKLQNFSRAVSQRLTIVVWSIHHDENNPNDTVCMVVGFASLQSSLLIQMEPVLAWIPLRMPPSTFEVKRPIATDLHGGRGELTEKLGPSGGAGGTPDKDGANQAGLEHPGGPSGLSRQNSQHLSRAQSGHRHTSADDEEDRTSLVLAIYGMMAIAAYFMGVCAFYMPVEGWTVRECLYFAVVTFTTVGYGDYVPTSDGSKLFTCLVALCGVSFIAVGVGVIGQEVLKVQQKLLEKGKVAAQHAVNSQFTEETDEAGQKAMTHINEHLHTEPPHAVKVIFWAFFPVITVIGIHAAVVGHVEKWSLVDAIYISTITGTSVGYGELYPKEPFSQWFSVVSIPVMVFCISYALGKVAQIPVQHEMTKLHKKMLTIEITEEDFDVMGNGDGDIDRTEFMVHMLKAMKKVDDALIDQLMDRFNRLDADGSGYISKDELKQVWQAKKEKVEGEGGARTKLGAKVLKHKAALTANGKVRPVQSHLSDVASTAQMVTSYQKLHVDQHQPQQRDVAKQRMDTSFYANNALNNERRQKRSASAATAFSPMGSFSGAT